MVFTSYLETLYICYLGMRSSRTAYFKVQRHFEVISFSMLYALAGHSANHNMVTAQSHNLYRNRSNARLGMGTSTKVNIFNMADRFASVRIR